MKIMKLNIKLEEGAILPKYSRDGDCAMDLVAITKRVVDKGEFGYIEYDTGVSIEIPKYYAGLLLPRGSISETGLFLANSVGLIDSNYRGTIKARFKWIPGTKEYNVGDRVVQLMIIPQPLIEWQRTEELSETQRGEEAFGSSGN